MRRRHLPHLSSIEGLEVPLALDEGIVKVDDAAVRPEGKAGPRRVLLTVPHAAVVSHYALV